MGNSMVMDVSLFILVMDVTLNGQAFMVKSVEYRESLK